MNLILYPYLLKVQRNVHKFISVPSESTRGNVPHIISVPSEITR